MNFSCSVKIFLLLLFFFSGGNIVQAKKKQSLQDSLNEIAELKNKLRPLVDTSDLTKVVPTKKGEELLFSDPQLQFDASSAEKKGFLEKLLDWISEKLFGNVEAGNVMTARNILLWTIIVIAVGIVVWLLWRSEWARLIREKPKSISFNFSDITENLDTIDFSKKIQDAVSVGDLRLAIRWHYLHLLYLLNKNSTLAFAPYKTNIDYVNELKGNKELLPFQQLSKVYDYVWYGEFILTEYDYHNYAEQFNQFERSQNVQGK